MGKLIRKLDLGIVGSKSRRKGSKEATEEMLDDLNKKRKKRGRPSLVDRRETLRRVLGNDKLRSMDGEAKRPIEQLSQKDFNELYTNVAREKGWPQLQK